MQPTFETTFVAAALMRDTPPQMTEPNKQVLLDIACPPGSQHSGTIRYARYPGSKLPVMLPSASRVRIEGRKDLFDYEPAPAQHTVHWYLNFANADLFCMYGGKPFAQDELQVMEHPALGALREALLSRPAQLKTMDRGKPTPIVISGVERRCHFDSDPDSAAGRPAGLYGRQFAAASAKAVAEATEPLDPPSLSNILAIEAPPGGKGRYTRAQIEHILHIAYSGFRAAQLDSEYIVHSSRPRVILHTGFWGCGAYGGNRHLMALLQIVAAWLANLDGFVFHAVDSDGLNLFRQAEKTFHNTLRAHSRWRRLLRLSPPSRSLSEILTRIEALGLEWGESDGN